MTEVTIKLDASELIASIEKLIATLQSEVKKPEVADKPVAAPKASKKTFKAGDAQPEEEVKYTADQVKAEALKVLGTHGRDAVISVLKKVANVELVSKVEAKFYNKIMDEFANLPAPAEEI